MQSIHFAVPPLWVVPRYDCLLLKTNKPDALPSQIRQEFCRIRHKAINCDGNVMTLMPKRWDILIIMRTNGRPS